MNVLVPLLESRQKRNLLRDGTIIYIVGEPVNCLQDGFFRAHALTVSPGIYDASPAFRSNVSAQAGRAKGAEQTAKRNPAWPEADGSPSDDQILRVAYRPCGLRFTSP